MEITIFARKRQTLDGKKTFYTYLTRLVNKRTGELDTLEVKFREECGSPKGDLCPMNIKIPKQAGNISEVTYTAEVTDHDTDIVTEEVRKKKVFWVKEWTVGSEYVDTSLDDYE